MDQHVKVYRHEVDVRYKIQIGWRTPKPKVICISFPSLTTTHVMSGAKRVTLRPINLRPNPQTLSKVGTLRPGMLRFLPGSRAADQHGVKVLLSPNS